MSMSPRASAASDATPDAPQLKFPGRFTSDT
jgi:hypothetical protein